MLSRLAGSRSTFVARTMPHLITIGLPMGMERAVIVGGGILGTMHALEASTHGWEVVHLEADLAPRRASVRNFGLVWISGRAPGPELELALRARLLWEQAAARTPDIGFRPDGSLTVAHHPSELALMAEAVGRADATARGLELLDAGAVRDRNPCLRGEIVGGLWCGRDAVIEPGATLGALRRTLESTGRYHWLPGRCVVDVRPGRAGPGSGTDPVVTDHLGTVHHGALVLLCTGDRLAGLGGAVGAALAAAPLRRCRLQMMETAPLRGRLTTAVADADSLRYYPGFALPGRAGLPPASAETRRWGMQLLMVQRAAGGLTIGDTHDYDEPFDFAVDETVYESLGRRAEAILGDPLPPVIRRWSGVYTQVVDDRLYLRHPVDDGVWLVTGPAGRGMTLSPAIAEETWKAVVG
jgi:FAD dependent oxidoreductase TIGR03364